MSFLSSLLLLLVFTHHLFRSSRYLTSPLSSRLISSHPVTIPVSLSFIIPYHLSRGGGVDLYLQPRSCIFLFFHNSTCSVTTQSLQSKQENIPRAKPRETLVDLRPSRPAFQSNTTRASGTCTQRDTCGDRIFAQNDSLSYATLDDDDRRCASLSCSSRSLR